MSTDKAPNYPPRTVTIVWTDGDEIEVRPSEDMADWEVASALAEAVKVWDEVNADAEQGGET